MTARKKIGAEPTRVVMLEDNPADVELIARQMKRDAFDAAHRIVANERDFRTSIADYAPQIILSDFSLPTFDGLTALQIARTEAPTVPFIFVSGTLGEERAIEALKSGASDYVLKDNLKRLVPAIRSALHQYELAKARDVAEDMLRRSESRLQDIIDTSSDWIWECDPGYRFTFSSPSLTRILGYGQTELLGRLPFDYIDPDDHEQLRTALTGLAAGLNVATSITVQWTHKTGAPRWLERKMVALRGNDGRVVGFRGIDRDVTTRREQDTRIGRLNRAVRFLSETNSAIVRFRDRPKLLKEACRLAVQIGGYAMATIYLRSPKSADQEPMICRAVSAKYAEARRPPSEALDGDGPVGRAMVCAEPVVVSDFGQPEIHVPNLEALREMGLKSCIALPLIIDGTPIGVTLLHADEPDLFGQAERALLRQVTGNITFSLQYLHSRESVEYLEYFDPLTSLANRSLYLQRLDTMTKTAARDDRRLVLLVFDISGLAIINDGMGHHAGDLVLQLVAERMKNLFRDSHCLCHLGGGRYAVASVDAYDVTAATTILRERVDFLFDKPFTINDQDLRISIKAGFAEFPEDGPDAEALLQHAQTALDHAKEAGEQYLRHRPDMNVAASERLSLTNRLRETVAQQRFTLNYQPKKVISSGAVDGFEALLRWPDSEVPPTIFVPLLESIGLIDEVGKWVITQALRESSDWFKLVKGGGFKVAVNVSPLQLKREEFAEEVLQLLNAAHANPSCLELEVTESMLMADPRRAGSILGRLRDAGVTVAIDDFGTGHSSLQLLSQLPVDVLKIDRTFVRDLSTNRSHRLVVQTTITLAKSLGMKTVAEGVETQEQMDILADLGCDTMQGYFILRPATAHDIGAWLAAQPSRVEVTRPMARAS